MEKKGVAILIVVLALIAGIFLLKDSLFSSNKEAIDTDNINKPVDEEIFELSDSSSDEGASAEEKQAGQIREFNLVAKRWEFNPSEINVNEGDTVILNVESIDVSHGFSLLSFNVNERLDPGNKIRVEFIADEKGTFNFFCNNYCGLGHGGMKGVLIVE